MYNLVQTVSLTVPVSEQQDHILGPRNAPVTLLEYGDFGCPHCAEAHLVVSELLGAIGKTARFVFRHFPLTQVHPTAQRAAEAAEAAGAQDKFWEMHDLLFENQEAQEDYDLVTYAQTLGVNMARFRAELLQGKYTPRVREEFLGGVRSGVNGTPTFFINGHRHDDLWDVATLLAAIEAEVQSSGRRR